METTPRRWRRRPRAEAKANEQFEKVQKLSPSDRGLAAKIENGLKAAAARPKS